MRREKAMTMALYFSLFFYFMFFYFGASKTWRKPLNFVDTKMIKKGVCISNEVLIHILEYFPELKGNSLKNQIKCLCICVHNYALYTVHLFYVLNR